MFWIFSKVVQFQANNQGEGLWLKLPNNEGFDPVVRFLKFLVKKDTILLKPCISLITVAKAGSLYQQPIGCLLWGKERKIAIK